MTSGTQEQSMDDGELPPYQLYKFRFWIAFVTCFTMITNAGIWATFMSISTTATTYYGTSAMGINILSLIFMALYIPVSPISSWVLDTKGIKTSVSTSLNQDVFVLNKLDSLGILLFNCWSFCQVAQCVCA